MPYIPGLGNIKLSADEVSAIRGKVGRLGGPQSHGKTRKVVYRKSKHSVSRNSRVIRLCAAFDGITDGEFVSRMIDNIVASERYAHLFTGGTKELKDIEATPVEFTEQQKGFQKTIWVDIGTRTVIRRCSEYDQTSCGLFMRKIAKDLAESERYRHLFSK